MLLECYSCHLRQPGLHAFNPWFSLLVFAQSRVSRKLVCSHILKANLWQQGGELRPEPCYCQSVCCWCVFSIQRPVTGHFSYAVRRLPWKPEVASCKGNWSTATRPWNSRLIGEVIARSAALKTGLTSPWPTSAFGMTYHWTVFQVQTIESSSCQDSLGRPAISGRQLHSH